jgi:hypothetical protein
MRMRILEIAKILSAHAILVNEELPAGSCSFGLLRATYYWERGRLARNAPQARNLGSWVSIHFRASRSLRAGRPRSQFGSCTIIPN